MFFALSKLYLKYLKQLKKNYDLQLALFKPQQKFPTCATHYNPPSLRKSIRHRDRQIFRHTPARGHSAPQLGGRTWSARVVPTLLHFSPVGLAKRCFTWTGEWLDNPRRRLYRPIWRSLSRWKCNERLTLSSKRHARAEGVRRFFSTTERVTSSSLRTMLQKKKLVYFRKWHEVTFGRSNPPLHRLLFFYFRTTDEIWVSTARGTWFRHLEEAETERWCAVRWLCGVITRVTTNFSVSWHLGPIVAVFFSFFSLCVGYIMTIVGNLYRLLVALTMREVTPYLSTVKC